MRHPVFAHAPRLRHAAGLLLRLVLAAAVVAVAVAASVVIWFLTHSD